jgi:tetratricopeptide (TPR) repeat protein
MLAHVLASEGKVDDALARLAELEARRPTAAGKVQMAGLHLRKGDSNGAITLLEAAIAQDPYLEGAWPPYLFTLFTKGDIPRFAEAVARGRAALPDNTLIAGFAGLHAAMTGRHAEARPLLLPALEADPGAPFLHHGLGMVERAEERIDAAESALQEEVRLHPPAVPSRRALVEIYAEQKRYAEQLSQLDALIQVEPPHVLNSHARAQALFNLKRFPEAHEEVRRCRSLDARYPACAMLEANTLKKLGRDKEAYTAYEAALALVGQAPPQPTPPAPATPTAGDAAREAMGAPATP